MRFNPPPYWPKPPSPDWKPPPGWQPDPAWPPPPPGWRLWVDDRPWYKKKRIVGPIGALGAFMFIGLLAPDPDLSPSPQSVAAVPSRAKTTEAATGIPSIDVVATTSPPTRQATTKPTTTKVTIKATKPTLKKTATKRPKPKPTKTTTKSVYYANCSAARAAGAAPLHRGEPGYRAGLDRDGDGVACE